jgi:hypothetical protein
MTTVAEAGRLDEAAVLDSRALCFFGLPCPAGRRCIGARARQWIREEACAMVAASRVASLFTLVWCM